MKHLHICFIALLLASRTAHTAVDDPPASTKLFADGDRVAFAGDSITAAGKWHIFISDFYLTRFPERKIVWSNAGIGGDDAGSVLARFDRDVLRDAPNRAVIMLGMNDVGTSHFVTNPTPRNIQSRDQSLKHYAEHMAKLIGRFNEKGIPMVLVTPSPYDETSAMTAPDQPGRNAALGEAAEIVKTLAHKGDLPVVDFHDPMTALNAKLQQADPSATLIGPDRVHPGELGHLVMAALFLEAQGAPSMVASVEVNVPEARCLRADNCAVANLKAGQDGLSFDYTPAARPFPNDANVRKADALVGFSDRLNREMLSVIGLKPGSHELLADGVSMGTFDAASFESGMNLALLDTPMQKEAHALADLNHRRGSLVMQLRTLEWMHIQLNSFGIGADDLATVKRRYDEMLASPKVRFNMPYFKHALDAYPEQQARAAGIAAEIQELSEKIETFPRPATHHLAIRPVGSGIGGAGLPSGGITNRDTPAYRAAKGFMRGANIGDYLEAPNERSARIYTEADLKLIRAEGFDHIRLPVGWHQYTGPAPDFKLADAIFAKTDQMVTNALRLGLNVMIDFHHFTAFTSDPGANADRYQAIWRQVAAHYAGAPAGVAFELLNEPRDAATTLVMNPIYAEAIRGIRQTNPQRTIFLGPEWNSPNELPKLRLPDNDDNIIVTLHSYGPMFFTHQGARFAGPDYRTTGIIFPGPPKTPLEPDPGLNLSPKALDWIHRYNTLPTESNPCSPQTFRHEIEQAQAWSEKVGRPVHFGEFGAFTGADQVSRARYYAEFRKALDEDGIGWAIWDWKGTFKYWDTATQQPLPGMREALFPAKVQAASP